jgi:hypothetical protein
VHHHIKQVDRLRLTLHRLPIPGCTGMAPSRNGTSSSRNGKNGTLPSMDNLEEEHVSELLDSLVDSRERRGQVWKEEMRRMSEVPEEGEEHPNSRTDEMSPLNGLKAILVASTAPKPSTSSQSTNQSGSSTPSQSYGTRTPREDISIQMVYQAVFCFWLLSFDEEIAGELNAKFGIIPILADCARNAVKEKVVRVIVATLKNLAEKAPSANISAMLGSKCLPLMESLSGRKWSDEEITQDIDVVKELLSEKLKNMR